MGLGVRTQFVKVWGVVCPKSWQHPVFTIACAEIKQALEDGLYWQDDTSNTDYQIDIGGPSQCGYDGEACYSQYMETVFLFVRE